MALFRTFIAIEISSEVRNRTAELIERLRKSDAKVSWTRPENLHLTLKFLGDTADSKIPDVCRRVDAAVGEQTPFVASLQQLGAFPKVARPRTVWIGVNEGLAVLQQLQSRIEDEMWAAGFKRERRRYQPHLTIGRVREGGAPQQRLAAMIAREADFSAGSTTVQEVLTMASFLDPQGATYQALGRTRLSR